jgi:hypothetical protein
MSRPALHSSIAAILALCASPSAAQEVFGFEAQPQAAGAYALVPTAIPDEVLTKIRNTPALTSKDIVGLVSLATPVLKAETIRFQNRSVLVIANTALDWVAIVTKDLVIEDPTSNALITRPASAIAEEQYRRMLAGSPGSPGINGRNETGAGPNREGVPGGDGTDGRPGTSGRTRRLPILYILANRVRWGTGSGEPPRPAITIMYEGIRGGDGGDGGNGGIGGTGGRGSDGDTTAFDCRHGPARGGDGGHGGRGGRGGNASDGGDGGTVVLASPTSLIADFLLLRAEGGDPGTRGDPGMSGRGGTGGRGGEPRGWCKGHGAAGANRASEIPPNFGPGHTASQGQAGNKELIKRSVDDLF